eukprot:2393902-Rhodomonas_salina.2
MHGDLLVPVTWSTLGHSLFQGCSRRKECSHQCHRKPQYYLRTGGGYAFPGYRDACTHAPARAAGESRFTSLVHVDLRPGPSEMNMGDAGLPAARDLSHLRLAGALPE